MSWLKTVSGTDKTLRTVCFVDDTTGFAAGDASVIIYTSDGGITWSPLTSPVSGMKFYSIHFSNKKTGYITGSGGKILKTTNGGQEWFVAGWPADADFNSIAFTDTLTGYIVTGSGECYKTIDGGINWSLKHTGSFMLLFDIQPVTSNLIFITGTGGSLARSSDAGDSWQIIPTGAFAALNGISFSDSLNGFICGDAGTLLITSDGGETWHPIPGPSSLTFTSVHSPASGVAYISSEKGMIYRYSASDGWLEYEYAKAPNLYAVAVPDNNLIQTAGEHGSIFVSPGNSSFYDKSINMSGSLRSIDYYLTTHGWICGDSGVVVRTTDGGYNWFTVSTGTTVNLRGIAATGENSAVAVGENGLILLTTDGGSTWLIQNSFTTNHLNAIAFRGSSVYGTIAGSGGMMLYTDDRGYTWSRIHLPFTTDLYAVRYYGLDYCVVAGDSGRILWSFDGGSVWSLPPPLNNYPYRGVAFGGLSNIHFVSLTQSPAVHQWGAQSGIVTYPIFNAQYSVNAIAMLDNNSGAAAADNGILLRRYYNPFIPVELVSFSAISSSSGITLTWKTATETNNSGFEVQRSVSEGEWKSLAFVNGTGTVVSSSEYIYIDDAPAQGLNRYRLIQKDFDGTVSVAGEAEAVFLKDNSFYLGQNYPNPFNPVTKISYIIPLPGHVSLLLYDALGRRIMTLVDEVRPAGASELLLNAEGISSGVYYYAMTSGGYTQYRKLMVVK
ncbi:MAG: hypothetical protein AMXMBFR48_28910 [Ignavibacteriales bacterium]